MEGVGGQSLDPIAIGFRVQSLEFRVCPFAEKLA